MAARSSDATSRGRSTVSTGPECTRRGAPYTPATVRVIEVRMLEGPNVYRLEPTVKIEVVLGRRRTWYGQRSPGRNAVVRLGARVPAARAPVTVRDLAAWVRRLHTITGAAGWLRGDG